MTSYLVMGNADYEIQKPIKVFVSKSNADKFIKMLNDYGKQFPPWPDGSNQKDTFLKKWCEKHDNWLNNHPLGRSFACEDGYYIQEIELVQDTN